MPPSLLMASPAWTKGWRKIDLDTALPPLQLKSNL